MTVPPANPLFAYVAAPDPSYAWRKRGETRRDGVTITDLQLVSQTWRGIRWEHHVQIFRPDTPTPSDTALLYNTGLDATEPETQAGALLAATTGLVCAFLYHVPNQPLFDGLGEDALIAYTLQQFLTSGEDDWPLLLPMTKSVRAAMTATQEFLQGEAGAAPTRFVVSGASKRGWTSWLAAATDERVCGAIPMVYDNLNIAAQMPHQVAVWGGYSSSIHDYTDLDLQAQMQTERGQSLGALIDPYTYRDRLTMPKLIINGTNDSYWATDALNLYWNDLPGPKSVLYVPNCGHGLNDMGRVFATSAAFLRMIARRSAWPWFDSRAENHVNALRIEAWIDAPMGYGARLWTATAPTKDFRAAVWQSVPMQRGPGSPSTDEWAVEIARPASGCFAWFAEAELRDSDLIFTLSTPIQVVGTKAVRA